jgi:hypothetical protein
MSTAAPARLKGVILRTNSLLKIGERITPERLWDAEGNEIPSQPLTVIRRATEREFTRQLIEILGSKPALKRARYFFEVLTD